MKLTKKQEELSKGLTNLQKHFAIHLASGKNQRDAYKAAGGKAKDFDQSASQIFSYPKVKAFYESLLAKAEKKAIIEKADALKILNEIMRNADEDTRARIAAIKQASDMQGWNAPKQTEIGNKDDKPLKVDSRVESADVAKAINDLMDKL
jgi:phage terminase small subunit